MELPRSATELESALAGALDAAYDLLEYAADQQNRVASFLPGDILVSTLPEVGRFWVTEGRPRRILAQADRLIQAFHEARKRLFGLLCQGNTLTVAAAIGEEVPWSGLLNHTVAH